MSDTVYYRLRELLDQYALGFPQTDSGVEIDILKYLFNENEAALFADLTAQLESPTEVARRTGRSVNEIAEQLAIMADKGLVFRKQENGGYRYSAIPFIHGLLEFQINSMDERLIRLVGRYIKEKYHDNLSTGSKSFMRTIPVHKSVASEKLIAPYNDAKNILREANLIVVTSCACRTQAALVGKGCQAPKNVCFMFGPMGQYYLDNHLGRQVRLEEALNILQNAHDAGLVTQPATAKKPFTMCNCCGCCCGFLRTINNFPNPADYVLSDYTASVLPDVCSGCGTCTERCQTRAIRLDDTGFAKINPHRCIGCGLCVTTCPEQAIELQQKPKIEQIAPPADTAEQMVQLAQKRGKDEKKAVTFGF